MARILILSPRDPIPVYSGLLERIYQLSNTLGETNEVRLLYPDEPSRRDEDGRRPDQRRFERVGLTSRAVDELDRRVPGYSPWRGLYKTHPWLYPAVRRHIRAYSPDVVIIEMPFLVPVAVTAARGHDIPIVLSEHNVQFKVTERLGIPGSRPLRAFETTVADLCDTVVTVSGADRSTLEIHTSTPIRVAPNGVDTARFSPERSADQLREEFGYDPLLVYHGSLGNAQNAEAVTRLTESIVPRLRQRFPELGLLLVGSNPPTDDTPGIQATGLVDDLPRYVSTPDVAVVPLRSGSGTKLKLLEYMASGTPVVTTPIGAEGIPVEDGETALVAETDDELVAATNRLLDDEDLRSRLASAGRELVTSQFDWEETLRPYQRIVSDYGERRQHE